MLVLLRLLRDLQTVADINCDVRGSEHCGARFVYVCGWDTYRICRGYF